MCETTEINISYEVGDKVIAKRQYDFMGEPIVELGQEWVVSEKSGFFTNIKNNDKGYWIGNNIFIGVFECD